MTKQFGMIVSFFVMLFVLALPVFAQTQEEDYRQRGEWMMDIMMGSAAHDEFDTLMEQRRGSQFTDDMHEALGQMGAGIRSSSGNFGMMGTMPGWGMMGTGYYGTVSIFGWLWAIVWSVNSVLIGILLWVLIKKYSKMK